MDQYCSCIYMKHTDPDGVLPNYDDVQRLHQRKTECWHTLTGNRGSDGVGVETLTNIDDRDRVDAAAVLGERGLVWEVELAAHDVAAADRQQGRSPLFSGAIIANIEEVEGARELAMDLGGKQLHVPGIHPQRQGVWKVVDEMRKSRGQVL